MPVMPVCLPCLSRLPDMCAWPQAAEHASLSLHASERLRSAMERISGSGEALRVRLEAQESSTSSVVAVLHALR